MTEEAAGFGDADYASAFEVTIARADVRSPEQWARAAFEDSPKALRLFVMFGWRHVLGFRLETPSTSGTVAGWHVVADEPEVMSLRVASGSLTALKRVRVSNDRVVMTTFVRYERPPGRRVWRLVTPVHHARSLSASATLHTPVELSRGRVRQLPEGRRGALTQPGPDRPRALQGRLA